MSSAGAESLFGVGLAHGYRPLAGVSDEMVDADGALRPHWRRLLDLLGELGAEELDARFEQLDGALRSAGASFRAYDTPGSGERAWPVSRLPLLIDADEWRGIEAGVIQRARLHEALLQDVYGPRTLVREGALPAALVAGSPEFLRPLTNVTPRGSKFLRLYAVDLSRGPDGRWWVMADRAQAPSGAGYALENRLALGAAFAEAFGAVGVARLAGFFQ
ncbi:MAG TPA: circularly permuted type 2 ATP-grasp protein, partial [Verrucomicrobiae bacterium]|nr:circularly permuted type 2 ATP-grasp protein [Verrucomicrobiae bacterium]